MWGLIGKTSYGAKHCCYSAHMQGTQSMDICLCEAHPRLPHPVPLGSCQGRNWTRQSICRRDPAQPSCKKAGFNRRSNPQRPSLARCNVSYSLRMYITRNRHRSQGERLAPRRIPIPIKIDFAGKKRLRNGVSENSHVEMKSCLSVRSLLVWMKI